MEALATRAAEAGDHATSTDLWRQLAASDPISSRIALGYIRALVDAGDRAGALRHARVYENILRAELDAPPDPAVTSFVASMRESPTRAHGSAAGARAAAPRSGAPTAEAEAVNGELGARAADAPELAASTAASQRSAANAPT